MKIMIINLQVVRDDSVKGPVPEYVKENRFAKLLNTMT